MTARKPPTWPVIPLALPAAVSIWAGWVGLGELTGFGVVQLLPGIWDGLRINTAVTLPIGMEAYAAYALHCWLHRGTPRRAKDFARVSSIAALVLGALGQVAYHLMAASGVQHAPWPIVALVACLPVGVLGMGATLAHLLSEDDEPVTTAQPVQPSAPQPVAPPVAPFRAGGFSGYPPIAPVRPEPVVSVQSDPVPMGRPDPVPVVQPADLSAGLSNGQPMDRPSDRPGRQPTDRPERAARTAPASRPDPVRRRAGKPRTDAQLARAVRELAEQNGGAPPSQYAVRQSLGVGSSRAARLLAELDSTPAGPPSHNGTATRKESAQ